MGRVDGCGSGGRPAAVAATEDVAAVSGVDWLVVLGLAGVLILAWIVDEMRAMDRRRLERDDEQESMRRLRRELRRHE